MDIPELFISYDNYNFYYSEQVYLAESLKNKSYFFLESTDDILQKVCTSWIVKFTELQQNIIRKPRVIKIGRY
jgi:adenine-specific DNA methylase